MSQSDLTPFGGWLLERIVAAGFRSPSAFANAAGVQPSMVLRWLHGRVQPSPDGLVRAAPLLGVPVREMLARGLDLPELDQTVSLPAEAARLARLLGPESPLPPAKRVWLERVVQAVMDAAEAEDD